MTISASQRRVYDAIVTASETGNRMPSRAQIREIMGTKSASSSDRCIAALIRENLIAVERSHCHNIATVTATGKATAQIRSAAQRAKDWRQSGPKRSGISDQVSANHEKIYHAIEEAAIHGHICPTDEQLAVLIGRASRHSVDVALKSLVAAGRLTVATRGKNRVFTMTATGKRTMDRGMTAPKTRAHGYLRTPKAIAETPVPPREPIRPLVASLPLITGSRLPPLPEPHHCQWSGYGDTGWCGAEIHDDRTAPPYCAKHMRRMMAPRQPNAVRVSP